MAITVTHPFVSPVPDEGDPSIVGPNEWNAAHSVTGTVDDAQLPNVNSNVGTFGSATQVAQVTLDAKGRVTAASNVVIAAGAGDVVGPASATDNAVARFDSTTGKLIQNSAFIVDDGGQVTSFGGNIKFPAVQVSSADPNTLDDYEEGTFTPSLSFSIPGDLSITYSPTLRAGWYTKIGDAVFLHIHIQTTSVTYTTTSGNLEITGSPFNGVSKSGNHGARNGGIQWEGITLAAGYTDMVPMIGNGNAIMNLRCSGSGLAAGAIGTSNIPSGGANILLRMGLGYTTT